MDGMCSPVYDTFFKILVLDHFAGAGRMIGVEVSDLCYLSTYLYLSYGNLNTLL